MKLPLGWLKDFVNIDASADELSAKLLGIGFEVEEIIYTGSNIENVVVGKIIDIKKHFLPISYRYARLTLARK